MPLWSKILLSILAIEILGGLGAAVTSSEISGWYAGLQKPPGTPPNALFGPVWISLYAMMGAAFALCWHRAPAGPARQRALFCFALQLILNMAWTPVFFGMHRMGLALALILALWLAIAATIAQFWRLEKTAAVLLIPYLLWVSYASYLNGGYWLLNR